MCQRRGGTAGGGQLGQRRCGGVGQAEAVSGVQVLTALGLSAYAVQYCYLVFLNPHHRPSGMYCICTVHAIRHLIIHNSQLDRHLIIHYSQLDRSIKVHYSCEKIDLQCI